MSCDLLSISVITIFDNNGTFDGEKQEVVVICFQFQLLRSLITTMNLVYTFHAQL